MIPAIVKKTIVLWALVLAACTIHLVPGYDQALVDGLNKTNVETQTLFAELENGSDSSKFTTYEPRYAAIIGEFEALRQRAANRQIPPLAKRISRIAGDVCKGQDATACVNTSPASLDVVIGTIREMRNRHRGNPERGQKSFLETGAIEGFRNQYDTAIQQALKVENALKR